MAKVGRAARNASLMRVETIAPSADGTVAAPTKTIADAETGEVYFVDVSTYTAVVKLPKPRAGMYFKFIMSAASNDEDTKDFAIITDAAGTDIHGVIEDGGGLVEVAGHSTIQLDNSEGSFIITAGDFLELVSDGTYWYVTGRILVDAGIVTNAGLALA